MRQTAVKAAVRDARGLLRKHGITLTVSFMYEGAGLMMQYDNGVIEIPAWQGLRTIGGLYSGFIRTILHEYGHAFCDQKRRMLRTARVRQVFGDFHQRYPTDGQLWRYRFGVRRAGYISSYARVHPEEDFAETFAWVVLRGLGALPASFDAVLQQKIMFVQKVLANR